MSKESAKSGEGASSRIRSLPTLPRLARTAALRRLGGEGIPPCRQFQASHTNDTRWACGQYVMGMIIVALRSSFSECRQCSPATQYRMRTGTESKICSQPGDRRPTTGGSWMLSCSWLELAFLGGISQNGSDPGTASGDDSTAGHEPVFGRRCLMHFKIPTWSG